MAEGLTSDNDQRLAENWPSKCGRSGSVTLSAYWGLTLFDDISRRSMRSRKSVMKRVIKGIKKAVVKMQ